jgi:tetratricopeptide (TPR) repeat protein
MPAPGQLLGGRYRLQEELATGGMGRVFAALDVELKRRVAVKLIAAVSPSDATLGRFRQEARALAVFNHPNILAIHDVGEDADFPFLVTELLEGATLRDRLPLLLRPALEIAAQIARGLAAAHERQIIHRDLKPGNVFITRDGVVKLIDFGIARLGAAAVTASLSSEPRAKPLETLDGSVVGTVGYMAPEQLRGEPLDARADLFAFGAVLYELVAGRRAFEHDTGEAVLTRQPAPLPRGVPRAIRQIVARCLEKDPARRYGSAGELLAALEKARAALPRPGRWLRVALALGPLLLAAGAFGWSQRAQWVPAVQLDHVESPDAQLGAVFGGAIERALSAVPGLLRPRGELHLRARLTPEGQKLRLQVQLERAGERVGEPVEALGTAAELTDEAQPLATRVRDEVLPLWRQALRRDRAHRAARNRTAEEKLDAYYDLMGPAPRLEFLARGRTLLDESLAADPEYVPALAARASLLRLASGLDHEDSARNLQLARASAEEALRLSPDDSDALLAECTAVRQQMRESGSDRDLETSISACSAAAQADPQSAEALYTLAQLYDQSCEDRQVIETLKLALERANRYDASRVMPVSFYLVSVALQRGHNQEAEEFSRGMLARQAEQERLAPLLPKAEAHARLQGAHLLRAAAMIRLGKTDEARDQLESELSSGAAAIGGLDDRVEAASLQGLAVLARRAGREAKPLQVARLQELEKTLLAAEAGRSGPSLTAGWFAFLDAASGVAWLEKRHGQDGCGGAFQRATLYRDAGHPEIAAEALNQCRPTEEWARRCLQAISAGLTN